MESKDTQKKEFWDFELHINNKVFHPRETTYFKRLPGGWLIRHMFIRGQRYTRSAILFVPDPCFKWTAKQEEIKWESVNTQSNPNYKIHLHRMKVPEVGS